MSITKQATEVIEKTRSARVYDTSCFGVTVAHLRAFLEQVDAAGLDDKASVHIEDRLSSFGSWHTVQITALERDRASADIVPIGEATNPEPATPCGYCRGAGFISVSKDPDEIADCVCAEPRS
ncbi:hypothetical protein [Microbacterium hydrocarbonoxydans]|uniref:hypothetical protein n=1 Tax=Microbacterium hydrocarbonoxydans TaxID=273678 RepID=UPI003D95FA7D